VHSAMPLRTAALKCPQAIFVDGHPERYREHSKKVQAVLRQFTPIVEMASVDEGYLDMTGTERLHGAPLAAAHRLHEAVKAATGLNCSIGASRTRLVSKIASDQAKPNGVLWILPGHESDFLAPLPVGKIPGVGKVTQRSLHEIGIRRIGDLTRAGETLLRNRFGKWGEALAGKALGLDAGGCDAEVGAHEDAKSISHEHTFGEDTADVVKLESTLARLSEMVAERLRRQGAHARTVQLKLRFSDFTTLTRAKTLKPATSLDGVISETARQLFRANWRPGQTVRLLGVGLSGFEQAEGQLNLFTAQPNERWRKAWDAVDGLREKFGADSVSLARGLKGKFRERTHEALPDVDAPDPE